MDPIIIALIGVGVMFLLIVLQKAAFLSAARCVQTTPESTDNRIAYHFLTTPEPLKASSDHIR